ncbi:uncharacterized protein N7496_001528 [Penicillium cataractarum]|uniref:Molybdenum cofactor biosynthesis protein F N-terminal domain-containing protein n=1 Tax=Penicillium cataractarum TaxID=2100454 RepID=A0A9W9VWF3_9EURO|nr:uncharacterized protein N7496_001528 [Penicillium cataractarum]KAJ5390460.1 hypothetical protein N7496_001528 [Penicillium cataractarum]
MASIAPEKIGSLTAPEVQVEHAPDKIGHDGCKDLAGHTFEYTYSSGVHYRISFDEEKAYFSLPWRIDGLTYGGLSYRARQLRDNQYLVHWLIPGRVGAVALVFDLTHKRVDAAALMPGKFELFDRATFDEFKSGGEGALYHKSPEEEIDPW